jgi:hypothetical protein
MNMEETYHNIVQSCKILNAARSGSEHRTCAVSPNRSERVVFLNLINANDA